MLLKNNFLFGIVATTICLCGVNGAIALTVLSSAEQRQISIDAAEFSNTRTGETLPICQGGEYVSKCNGYDVGFNWLKSATFPTNLLSYTTKNYYVGDNSSELFEQMRIFFGDTNKNIFAKNVDGRIVNVAPAEYIKDREYILNYLCHPANSAITCKPCPNGTSVPESSVDLDNEDKTIQGSWKFHTIADCYVKDFEDSTGSYYYIDPSTNQPAKCYYTNSGDINNFNGDAIQEFRPGLQRSRTSN